MSRRRDRSDDRVLAEPSLGATLADASARGRAAVVSLSFWTAVILPALLVGLLFSGIETTTQAAAFLAIAGLEILALIVGRAHSPE